MQTQKMSLANIKGKLSRAEMKNIMAGSGSASCSSGPCTLFVNGTTYSGTCGFYSGNGSGGSSNPTWSICECKTEYGQYIPTSGTSHCQV